MKKKKKAAGNKWHMKDVDSSDRCWWWLASLFMAAMLAGIAVACHPEEPIQSKTEEEGLPATLRIDVNAHEPIATQTRAVNTTAIANLHVLVYNSAGELIGKNYAATASSIVVNTRSASNCTIYAIANTGNPNLFDGKAMKETDLKSATASITTWDALANGTHLVMTGKVTGVTIAAGNPSSNKIGNLSVSRMVAQVTLKLTTDAADNIVIHNYRIYGLPKQAYYVARPTTTETSPDDTGNTAAGDDAAKPATPAHWISSPVVSVEAANKVATFYMYENRRGVKTNITAQKDKIKANAPDSATYVVINGETNGYKYIWRVYLGANETSNFNMKRNCTYTYNIKLKSSGTDTRVTVTDMFETLAGGNANCYMVAPGASVNIPVERANESPLEIDGSVYNPTAKTYYQLFYNTKWTAEVVWQTVPGLISISNKSGTGAKGKYFTVETSPTTGNAVIAVKVGDKTLWSWHIWVTTYNGNTTYQHNNNANNNPIFMDRNLGANSATKNDINACGLYYQWGRKDPFPGMGQQSNWINVHNPAVVYKNNESILSAVDMKVMSMALSEIQGAINCLTISIRQPFTYYTQSADWFSDPPIANSNLWGGYPITVSSPSQVPKTVFDPCPKGWRVPAYIKSTSPFEGFPFSPPTTVTTYGVMLGSNFLPFASGRDSRDNPDYISPYIAGDIYYSGMNVHLWSASSVNLNSYGFGLSPEYMTRSYTYNRSFGYNIRCSKE